MTMPTMAPAQDMLSDLIVKQMSTVYPQIATIEVPGIQTMVAMTLATAGTLGREMTYEQAFAEAMRMYANAADGQKLLDEQRAKARADAFKLFSDSIGPLVESEALNIALDARPHGIRILVNYNVDKFDEKNEPVKDSEGNIVKLPIEVKIEPIDVKRIRATTGTGSSGRTPGVFKLFGTTDPIQLSQLAKSEGKPESDKTPARDWLVDNGFTIDETADSNNIKWVRRVGTANGAHSPAANPPTPPTGK